MLRDSTALILLLSPNLYWKSCLLLQPTKWRQSKWRKVGKSGKEVRVTMFGGGWKVGRLEGWVERFESKTSVASKFN